MENEPEVIRNQMAETRTALTEKVEALEQQVVDTVQAATATVSETIAGVKDAVTNTVTTIQGSVSETVGKVTNTFDVSRAVSRHPWIAVGCSTVTGYLVGSLVRKAIAPVGLSFQEIDIGSERGNGIVSQLARAERASLPTPNGKPEPTWLDELGQSLGDEGARSRGLMLATALGAARDWLVRQVPPSIGPQLAEIVDSATAKLGSEPVRTPVLTSAQSSPHR